MNNVENKSRSMSIEFYLRRMLNAQASLKMEIDLKDMYLGLVNWEEGLVRLPKSHYFRTINRMIRYFKKAVDLLLKRKEISVNHYVFFEQSLEQVNCAEDIYRIYQMLDEKGLVDVN